MANVCWILTVQTFESKMMRQYRIVSVSLYKILVIGLV